MATINCGYSITTGSTISECAKVLKEKGAEKIYVLSLAIAE